MKTGTDLDHLHPTCTGAPNAGCVPAPYDGNLLQIMPWPSFQEMTDHNLRAIYEYLSAIPYSRTAGTESPSQRLPLKAATDLRHCRKYHGRWCPSPKKAAFCN
jgi:hypothetical protein